MSDPIFPPLLKGHGVAPSASPFEIACDGAERRELSAGDVVWSHDLSRVKLAVVLEPEIALVRAMQMVTLGVVACGDTIGALAPPQVGVTYRWPASILVNGAKAAELCVSAAGVEDPADVPNWLVIGLNVTLRRDPNAPEPGLTPDITTLDDEGCGGISRSQVIESFCRHFLTWLNKWESDGFDPVHESWLYRAADRGEVFEIDYDGDRHKGTLKGLDDNGNLLVKTEKDGVKTLSLMQMLEPCETRTAI